jgi:hypothetical protein
VPRPAKNQRYVPKQPVTFRFRKELIAAIRASLHPSDYPDMTAWLEAAIIEKLQRAAAASIGPVAHNLRRAKNPRGGRSINPSAEIPEEGPDS